MQVILGGAEVKKYRRLLQKFGCTAYAFNYMYLQTHREQGREILQQFKAENPSAFIMVTSGVDYLLHKYLSFRTDVVREGQTLYPGKIAQLAVDDSKAANQGVTRQEVRAKAREHHRSYATWLARNEDLIDLYDDCAVSALLADDLATGLVEQWALRKELYAGLRTGAGLVFCPQLDDEADVKHMFGAEWKGCVKYVGLSAHPCRTSEYTQKFFHKYLPLLTAQKAKVHLFRQLREDVSAMPYASVSSGGWLFGSRFGLVFKYQGQFKMLQIPVHQQYLRRTLQAEVQDAGVDMELFSKGDPSTVNAVNALVWCRFQADAARQHRNEYWNTQDARSEATALARSEFRTYLATVRHDYNTPTKTANEALALTVGRFCNTCVLQDRCPLYKADTTCAVVQRASVRNAQELQDVVSALIELQLGRVQFAVFAERLTGTVLDASTSKEVKEAIKLIERGKNVFDNRDTVTVTAKGDGILSRLFAGYGRSGQSNPSAKLVDSIDSTDETS